MCEAFNATILKVRYKSMFSMLEKIRLMVIRRIVKKREFCNSRFKGDFGPKIGPRLKNLNWPTKINNTIGIGEGGEGKS